MASLDGFGNLVLSDLISANDQLLITGASGDVQITNLNGGPIDSTVGSGSGTDTILVSAGSFSGHIIINTGDGNDAVTIDAGTLATLGKNVELNGGNDFDTLTVTGGSFATAMLTYNNANDGSIALDSLAIDYTGLEPVDMSGTTASDVVLNLTSSDDDARLHENGGAIELTSNNGTFETTLFATPSGSITINADSGNDIISVEDDLGDAGFTGSVVVNGQGDDDYFFIRANQDFSVTVDGAGETTGDTLEVDCQFQFAVDTGTEVRVQNYNSVSYGNIEGVTLTNLQAPPTFVYVNDDWSSLSFGDDPDGPGGATAFGADAFANITDAIGAVADFGFIQVYGGTYNETLTINKSVTILNAEFGSATVTLNAGGAATAVTVGGFIVTLDGIDVTNFTGTGIYALGVLGFADANISGGAIGILVDGGSLGFTNAKILNSSLYGVQLTNAAVANLSQCEIIGTGTTAAGVMVTEGQADILISKVTGNVIGVAVGALGTGSAVDCFLGGNSSLGVQNLGGSVFNASFSWWGTNSEAGVQAKASGLVDFTPYLDTGTNLFPTVIGFIGDLSKLHVSSLGQQTSGDRIQEGVDNVTSGGTVVIHGGTYSGNVQTLGNTVTLAIDSLVTVNGNVTLDANDTLRFTINGVTPGTQYGQLNVNGTINLGGSTVATTGSYVPAVGNSFHVINRVGGATGTFANSLVLINFVPAIVHYTASGVDLTVELPHDTWVNDTWIITNDVGTPGLSLGDTVMSNTGAGDTLVTGKIYGYNAFSGVQAGVNAVDVNGIVHILAGTYNGSVAISKNLSVQGQGDAVTHVKGGGATVGIAIAPSKTVSISGIELTNFCGVGIDNQGTLTLSSSTILGGLGGIVVTGGTLNMSSTIVKGALIAGVTVLGNGTANITTSEISNTCVTVVGILIGNGHVTVTNSIVTGNGVGLVLLCGTLTVHDSNLAGNIIHAIENYTNSMINAEGNWWGSKKEKDIKDEIFGKVDYSPWLTNGTDHDGGARGFDG